MDELRKESVGDVERVGLLAEPTRRELYDFVSGANVAVSREQAAEGTGVPAHSAKFHLDKLVEGGLLETEFHKLTGRTGPGSGRPSKHYRRKEAEIAVTLPPRQYDLLSRVLTDVVASAAAGEPLSLALKRVAVDTGAEMGREHAANGDVESALRSCGYEPSIQDNVVSLRNCPFRGAAERHVELVCGINVDFVTGVLRGIGDTRSEAHLSPAPGRCCVAVHLM